MGDMIFSKEEMIDAAKKMVDYADALAEAITQYRAILQYIQAQGMVDTKVCAALASLDSKLLPYETAVSTVGGGAMKTLIQTASNLDALDNYTYPEGNWEDLRSTLAGFLG